MPGERGVAPRRRAPAFRARAAPRALHHRGGDLAGRVGHFWHLSEGNKSPNSKTCVRPYVHSGTVYSSKNLEKIQMHMKGTSLLVQWLRLQALIAGGQGLIFGLGTRSHMLQLRVCML